ncbi:hypothetical protein ES705_46845 [subsurface metagenome]
MKSYKKTFDKSHKVTRILLSDYLALKQISQAAGISMAEALHRLIEHQAQLPLLDRIARPVSVIATQPGLSVITAKSVPALRTALVTSIATNGSKVPAFRINTKGVKYE